jgi:hypothetical protein
MVPIVWPGVAAGAVLAGLDGSAHGGDPPSFIHRERRAATSSSCKRDVFRVDLIYQSRRRISGARLHRPLSRTSVRYGCYEPEGLGLWARHRCWSRKMIPILVVVIATLVGAGRSAGESATVTHVPRSRCRWRRRSPPRTRVRGSALGLPHHSQSSPGSWARAVARTTCGETPTVGNIERAKARRRRPAFAHDRI